MPEKVKLPREVADIADYVQKLGSEKFNMAQVVLYIDVNMRDRLHVFLNSPKYDGYFLWYSALVNGYEVEETPEDVVRNFYKTWSEVIKHEIQGYAACRFRIEGMITTLNALNIKIKGVNA